jgi:hypothetical protein
MSYSKPVNLPVAARSRATRGTDTARRPCWNGSGSCGRRDRRRCDRPEWRRALQADLPPNGVGTQLCLNGLEQVAFKDRLVLPAIQLAVIDDLAEVESVLEQIGEGSHAETDHAPHAAIAKTIGVGDFFSDSVCPSGPPSAFSGPFVPFLCSGPNKPEPQEVPILSGVFWSERRDLNSGPPVPQTGALTGTIRHGARVQ